MDVKKPFNNVDVDSHDVGNVSPREGNATSQLNSKQETQRV